MSRLRLARWLARSLALVLAMFAVTLPAGAADPANAGRIRLKYWEKWTGSEKDAMQAVVDDYNRSQSRVFVDLLSISGITQKTLIATAGGNPPDIAGLWANEIAGFAAKNALLPLDELASGTNVDRRRYLPIYWDMVTHEGKVFAVPSTPATIALHWNKRLFREAGLDPEQPPRTLAELDAFAKRLTKLEGGELKQIGFLPSEPVWWPHFWPYFFGGKLWDGGDRILADSTESLQAFQWVQSYAQVYGVGALQNLSSSFGNFASAQNPFMNETLAMVLQGVWMASYIAQYAPGLEWGAAPFPSLQAGGPPIGVADTDVLVIPRGAAHAREAFAFLDFVAEQRSTEKLNLGQRKNSPLVEVSEDFYRQHKHPYIRMFQQLAASTATVAAQPQMSVWQEYRNEIANAFQRVWLLQSTPEQALATVQERIQRSWDRERRRQSTPPSRLLSVAPFVLIGLLVALIIGMAWRERARHVQLVGQERASRQNASLGRGLLFFSPWGIGLLVFTVFPVMASLVYSFCDYSVLTAPRWIGLDNFAELFQDEVFWVSLKNTLIFALVSLPLGLVLAFFVALMLDANVRGSGVYRTLVFLPSLMPIVASSLVWLWIFNTQFGVLNHMIQRFSFGWIPPLPWLADPRSALPSLIFMTLWSVGQTVVILLASMQDVPSAVYEAADIDGASWWHKVWHITLPLTSPVIYFNAILGLVAALQIFTQPYIMTGGGPARATLTYTMRLYDNAFVFLRMGYASAMAWILFLVILGLTAVAVQLGKRRVHYTGA